MISPKELMETARLRLREDQMHRLKNWKSYRYSAGMWRKIMSLKKLEKESTGLNSCYYANAIEALSR